MIKLLGVGGFLLIGTAVWWIWPPLLLGFVGLVFVLAALYQWTATTDFRTRYLINNTEHAPSVSDEAEDAIRWLVSGARRHFSGCSTAEIADKAMKLEGMVIESDEGTEREKSAEC